MKKKLTLALAIMLILVSFGSCKNKEVPEKPGETTPPQSETIPGGTTDQTDAEDKNQDENNSAAPIEDEKTAAEKKIDISMTDVNDSVTLKDSGEEIYSKTVQKIKVTAIDKDYSDGAKKISTAMRAAHDRHNKEATELKNSLLEFAGENDVTTPWCLEVKYTLGRSDSKAVSILENVYYNAGGPHPTIADFGYNFDPATGDQITLSSFTNDDEEIKASLNDVINKKLHENYSEDLLSPDYLMSGTYVDVADDSWYFKEDGTGITIVFNQYDIAPYAAGTFEVDVDKNELPEAAAKYFLK